MQHKLFELTYLKDIKAKRLKDKLNHPIKPLSKILNMNSLRFEIMVLCKVFKVFLKAYGQEILKHETKLIKSRKKSSPRVIKVWNDVKHKINIIVSLDQNHILDLQKIQLE